MLILDMLYFQLLYEIEKHNIYLRKFWLNKYIKLIYNFYYREFGDIALMN